MRQLTRKLSQQATFRTSPQSILAVNKQEIYLDNLEESKPNWIDLFIWTVYVLLCLFINLDYFQIIHSTACLLLFTICLPKLFLKQLGIWTFGEGCLLLQVLFTYLFIQQNFSGFLFVYIWLQFPMNKFFNYLLILEQLTYLLTNISNICLLLFTFCANSSLKFVPKIYEKLFISAIFLIQLLLDDTNSVLFLSQFSIIFSLVYKFDFHFHLAALTISLFLPNFNFLPLIGILLFLTLNDLFSNLNLGIFDKKFPESQKSIFVFLTIFFLDNLVLFFLGKFNFQTFPLFFSLSFTRLLSTLTLQREEIFGPFLVYFLTCVTMK